jgi:hypothetical protein
MEQLYTSIQLPFGGAHARDEVAVDISHVLVVRTHGNDFWEFCCKQNMQHNSIFSYPRRAINPFVTTVIPLTQMPKAADDIWKLTKTGWHSPKEMRRWGLKPFLKIKGHDAYVPLDAHVSFRLCLD